MSENTQHGVARTHSKALLWAVWVRGPDDVVAVASYDDAVRLADGLNWWILAQPMTVDDPCVSAVPILWDSTPERHATDLAKLCTRGHDYAMPTDEQVEKRRLKALAPRVAFSTVQGVPDELRELSEKATQGKWTYGRCLLIGRSDVFGRRPARVEDLAFARAAVNYVRDLIARAALAQAGSQPSSEQKASVVCAGCGCAWDDAELDRQRSLDPKLLSCCPERKVAPAHLPSPAPDGWRDDPENAPRDGTAIDLWIDVGTHSFRAANVKWGQTIEAEDSADEGWINDCGLYAVGEDEEVTHWMMPPAPPAASGSEG